MVFQATAGAVRFVGFSISAAPTWMRRTLFACLLCLTATLGLSGYQNFDKVAPGVQVAGIPLGGLSYTDARVALDQQARQFNQQSVTITFREHSWQPRLEELGITLDSDSAWSDVVRAGSGRHIFDRALRSLHIRSGPILLGTPLTIDARALQDYCEQRMSELGLAPVNSELNVEGDTVTITPDSDGYVVSVDRLRQDLIRGLNGFTTPDINLLATYTQATVRSEELEPQIAALSTALTHPLRLYTETDQWEISPHQLTEHLAIKDINGRSQIVIDADAISGLVNSIANEIDLPVSHGPIDDSGPYPRVITPHDGRTVNRAELEQRIHHAITNGTTDVEIPVTITASSGDIGSVLNDYGITNLIATGSSSFAGSEAGRTTNLRRAAELIDGTLIGPGEIFSFNRALGSIVDAGGFVPASAAEGVIPGSALGGGVCQVSTSLFRAVLAAGMPITEWHPHTYRSLYYEQDGSPPGLDALIQQPDDDPLNGLDLKFENVTDGWLLIRVATTGADDLKVMLYGQSTGFEVAVLDPVYSDIIAAEETPIEEIDESLPPGSVELWQPARDGVTMIIHRTVSAADGTILSDEDFIAYYQPQGPVYRISADMAGADLNTW